VAPLTNKLATAFNAWAREGAGARMEDAHAPTGKKVLDRIPVGYDQSFIDLGCGNGWATRYMAERVPTIGLCVGVDVSEELVKEARRAAVGKLPVKFLVAPMEEVPFGEASFNHAFSMEAIYYTTDALTALKAVWRLLKQGGSFHVVIDYYRENALSAAWKDDISVPMQFLGQEQWVELFRKAGFVEVHDERVMDDRAIPADLAFPWGGFKTRADLHVFRTEIGSLYLRGVKGELSHALDPFLDRARRGLASEEKAQGPSGREPPAAAPKEKKKRFGRK
jgi:SAM-dependent methyltransferase